MLLQISVRVPTFDTLVSTEREESNPTHHVHVLNSDRRISPIWLLLAAHGFIVLDWRCDMKSFATAIALAILCPMPKECGHLCIQSSSHFL